MSKIHDGRIDVLVRARAVLDEPHRVFSRRRAVPGGPFVQTEDLGVISLRKYRYLKEGTLVCYIASKVQDSDAHKQFVEFYLNEMAQQQQQK